LAELAAGSTPVADDPQLTFDLVPL
jgi:hypothetical protein